MPGDSSQSQNTKDNLVNTPKHHELLRKMMCVDVLWPEVFTEKQLETVQTRSDLIVDKTTDEVLKILDMGLTRRGINPNFLLKFIDPRTYEVEPSSEQLDMAFEGFKRFLVDYVVKKSVAFVGAVPYEILLDPNSDISLLVKSSTVIALLQIIDHLMDWGIDEFIPKAIGNLKVGYYQMYNQNFSDVIRLFRVDQSNPRQKLLVSLYDLLNEIGYSETDKYELSTAMLTALINEHDFFEISSRFFGLGGNNFANNDDRSKAILYLIVDVALDPCTKMIYSALQRTNPGLPSLTEIRDDSSLQAFNVLCELFIRINDDWGDRFADAGSVGIRKNVNIFNEFDRSFVQHMFDAAGMPTIINSSEGTLDIIELIGKKDRRVPSLMIQLLGNTTSKIGIDAKFLPYLIYLKRITKAGYWNSAGDENIRGN